MTRPRRSLSGLLVLLMLLAACGEDGESSGSDDVSTMIPSQTATTATESPTSEPASSATSLPATATPTVEPTVSASPEPDVTSTGTSREPLEYGLVTTWDATWEGLGAMVIGPDQRLYVDDHVQKELMVFTTDGDELESLEYPAAIPEKAQPRNDLAVGPDGRIYLLEQSAATRVQVFEQDGTMVNEWGGTTGFEPESLFDARVIVVGPDGYLFTAKPGLLQKFTVDGQFVAAWDRVGEHLFPREVYDMEVADGALYLAVTGFRDDQAATLTFDFEGNLIAEPMVIGEANAGDRIFPGSLAVGPEGNLFIVDPFVRDVVVLSPAGDELSRWPLDDTERRYPFVEIAVDDAGRVYVADDAHKTITVYTRVTG